MWMNFPIPCKKILKPRPRRNTLLKKATIELRVSVFGLFSRDEGKSDEGCFESYILLSSVICLNGQLEILSF